jgi:hypothetical protein
MDSIKGFSGTSAGSQTASLLAAGGPSLVLYCSLGSLACATIGYSGKELGEALMGKQHFSEFSCAPTDCQHRLRFSATLG